MKKLVVGLAIVLLLASGTVLANPSSQAETNKKAHNPPEAVVWVVCLAVLVAYGITLWSLWKPPENGRGGRVQNGQAQKKWSLARALSEESKEVETITSTDPTNNTTVVKKTENVLAPSSSRLIAFLGLIGILGIFLGTGFYMLWSLFSKGTVSGELDKISKFLAVGGTIFVPYLANQLKDIFKK